MRNLEKPDQDFAQVKVEAVNLSEHAEVEKSIKDRLFRLRQEIHDLELKAESMERSSQIIKDIPILFDNPDFFEIENRLETLAAAGIKEIKIGEHIQSIDELQNIVRSVDRYSYQLKEGSTVTGEKEIDVFLAHLGVTRQKISSSSRLGFRDAMKECIANDSRAIVRPRSR